ncbi:hypothetical protein [Nostoc sp.]|uniref:hypothetical protein n=1 Tax=Nostoc sp. TaxID=1180 RepID=UPI002FF92003
MKEKYIFSFLNAAMPAAGYASSLTYTYIMRSPANILYLCKNRYKLPESQTQT